MSHYLFLVASTREPGHMGNTEWLARQAAAQLPAQARQTWLNLSETPLPEFVDIRHTAGRYPMPEGRMKELLDATLACTDLVLVAPVYWFSFPAALKTYLDHWSAWLRVPGLDFKTRMSLKRLWLITTNGDRAKAQPMINSAQMCANFLSMTMGGVLWGKGGAPDAVHSDPAAIEAAARFFSPPPAQAMVLAAGRGERMRPITDTTPKPLLTVGGQPLLAWHLAALARARVAHTCINTAWLEEQISARFGDAWGTPPEQPSMTLSYSREGHDFGGALETAGGIARALPRLDAAFWVVAGDVHMPDFEFDPQALARFMNSPALAHLWLVPNPPHHPRGDFGLAPDGRALNLPDSDPAPRYTYSTVGLYKRELFASPWCDIPSGNPLGIKTPLGPLLRRAMDNRAVTAEIYRGPWTDVGTPERLAQLNPSR